MDLTVTSGYLHLESEKLHYLPGLFEMTNVKKLTDLSSLSDLAAFVGTSEKQLEFLLNMAPRKSLYRAFKLAKRRGGFRVIRAPRDDLKHVQRLLATRLTAIYRPRKSVHGFCLKRSVKTNAQLHVRKRFVFNLDLEDFFPSITYYRIRGLFLAEPFAANKQIATALATLCCHDGNLPQGAPTSPVLSNMICARMDREIAELARTHRCFYSRYADDISISKRVGEFPADIGFLDDQGKGRAGFGLAEIIASNGFNIHPSKIHLHKNSERQRVTGLVVNNGVNVPRRFVRQIRAMIHAWQKYGEDAANEEHATRYYRRHLINERVPQLRDVILGKLNYLKMIKGPSDPVYKNLQIQFLAVYPKYLAIMEKENRILGARDVFISHASEDKDSIVRPLVEALIARGFSVWFDEFEIRVGDSLRQKIDDGLARSRYGIVILSPDFFGKRWPRRELDGLTSREDAQGGSKILPIVHRMSFEQMSEYSPTLAGLKCLHTSKQKLNQLIVELERVLRSPI